MERRWRSRSRNKNIKHDSSMKRCLKAVVHLIHRESPHIAIRTSVCCCLRSSSSSPPKFLFVISLSILFIIPRVFIIYLTPWANAWDSIKTNNTYTTLGTRNWKFFEYFLSLCCFFPIFFSFFSSLHKQKFSSRCKAFFSSCRDVVLHHKELMKWLNEMSETCTWRFMMRLVAFHAPFAVYLLKYFFKTFPSSSFLVGARINFFSIDFHREFHIFERHLMLTYMVHRTIFKFTQHSLLNSSIFAFRN